ncbi:hypothetical protein GUJ93_ZPchr0002g25322 [Zizania palustris]|uniref:Retrovirus-related Pol polyprotein from transposon TNT 1-94-like beta-barrel domain-containing protein n=1 Tax=Zizania palustris TaxID=103762 RepID=A0A8J5S1C7_ZIZPA|nr:hypothetical protein GUJ93_ZPchr0002g25322 [Zizania palustris]
MESSRSAERHGGGDGEVAVRKQTMERRGGRRRGGEGVPPKGFRGVLPKGSVFAGCSCAVECVCQRGPAEHDDMFVPKGSILWAVQQSDFGGNVRFAASEPELSGRFDARRAGSSVTKAAWGRGRSSGQGVPGEGRKCRGWLRLKAFDVSSGGRHSKGHLTKDLEVKVHQSHGLDKGLRGVCSGLRHCEGVLMDMLHAEALDEETSKGGEGTPKVGLRSVADLSLKGFDGFGSKPSMYRRLTSVKRRPSSSKRVTEASAHLVCEGGFRRFRFAKADHVFSTKALVGRHEVFSVLLKFTEITKASLAVHRNSLPQPLALVSGSSHGTTAEPRSSGTCVLVGGFALSSLVSVIKNGFSGCFECGDTSNIKANCPKLKRREESEHPKHRKKERKPYVKGKRGKVAKRVAKDASRAFVMALGDIDTSSIEESSSDEEEESTREEEKKEKKARDFTGLCFMADNTHNGDELDSSEVPLSYDQLSIKVDELNEVVLGQDRLLVQAARDRKDLRLRLEFVSTDYVMLKSKIDDVECESCTVFMGELAQLRFVHAQTIDELETAQKQLFVVECRPNSSDACSNCSLLIDSINLRDKYVRELEVRLESAECSKDVQPACPTCITLKDQLSFASGQAENIMTENEYLLSMVNKCTEENGRMDLLLAKTKMCADRVIDRGLKDTWIMDSGCSRHMTGNTTWFFSLTTTKQKEQITFGNNQRSRVKVA